MADSYPREYKKTILEELRKFTNNAGHKRSIKLMNKIFQPIRNK